MNKRKALITGANGFVGMHLKKELEDNNFIVLTTSRSKGAYDFEMDVTQMRTIKEVLESQSFDVIFHLAGQSSVASSWVKPSETFDVNVIGTINLLESMRSLDLKSRVVIIGSADQYGIVDAKNQFVNENCPQKPISPYAISKRTQEDIACLYRDRYNMDICMTRSFNHIGLGQKLGFVLPDLASRIAMIETGQLEKMTAGNLDVYRDFTDVKDVVRAYRLIAQKGSTGEIYNVGSGKAISIKEILSTLIEIATVDVVVESDPSLFRKAETTRMICDYSKLRDHTGWNPQYPIEQSIREVLDYYRQENKSVGK